MFVSFLCPVITEGMTIVPAAGTTPLTVETGITLPLETPTLPPGNQGTIQALGMFIIPFILPPKFLTGQR